MRFLGENSQGQGGLTAKNLKGLDGTKDTQEREDTGSASGDGSIDPSEKTRVNKEYLEELVDYRYASPEQTGRIGSLYCSCLFLCTP
jgi:hypothetical protein